MSDQNDLYDLAPEDETPRPAVLAGNQPPPGGYRRPTPGWSPPPAGGTGGGAVVGRTLLGLALAIIVALPLIKHKTNELEWSVAEALTRPGVTFSAQMGILYPLAVALLLLVTGLGGRGPARAGLLMLAGAGYLLAASIPPHWLPSKSDGPMQQWLAFGLILAWMLTFAGGLGRAIHPGSRGARAAALLGGLVLLVILLAPVWGDGKMLGQSAWDYGTQDERWRTEVLTGWRAVLPWLSGMGALALTALGALCAVLPPRRDTRGVPAGAAVAFGLAGVVFAAIFRARRGVATLLMLGLLLMVCGPMAESVASMIQGKTEFPAIYSRLAAMLKFDGVPLVMLLLLPIGLGDLLAMSGQRR